jgi:hypothetical protein
MEYATAHGRVGGTFAGLARQSGFTERDCQLAAAADPGLVVGIIRVAQLRGARRAQVSGAVALARLHQLRAAGLL